MDKPSLRNRAFTPVRKFAIGLNVIPEGKKARLFLKRVVFGSLKTMPHDISMVAPPTKRPEELAMDGADEVHQVLLCAGLRS